MVHEFQMLLSERKETKEETKSIRERWKEYSMREEGEVYNINTYTWVLLSPPGHNTSKSNSIIINLIKK